MRGATEGAYHATALPACVSPLQSRVNNSGLAIQAGD